MIQKEFQRMMAELERADFQTLLDYYQHREEREGFQVSNGRYEIGLEWKWHSFDNEKAQLQPAEIIPWLKAEGRLDSHERQLMLRHLSVEVRFDYADNGLHRAGTWYYWDNVIPVWKEMRFQLKKDGAVVREGIMQRDELYLGKTLLTADESVLGRVVVTDLSSLGLAQWDGGEAEARYDRPYQQLLFRQDKPADSLQAALGLGCAKTELCAGVYYDPEEWNQRWVSLDVIVYKDSNRVSSHFFLRDEFRANDVSRISSIPVIEFLEKEDDHVTIKVTKTKSVVRLQRGEEKEILREKGFRYTASLRMGDRPRLRGDEIHSDPMPTEWMVKAELFPHQRPDELEGVAPAATKTIQLVKTNTEIDFSSVGGVDWNRMYIAAYVEGELLVGELGRFTDDRKRRFSGFLHAGETICVEVREHYYDDEAPNLRTATMRLTCWEGEAAACVVEDGVMLSAANEETVVVPDGVVRIDYKALLTAPLMRHISLPASVRQAEDAIKEFRYENDYPDITADYRGTLHEWFENCPGTLASCCRSFMVEGTDLVKMEHLTVPAAITAIPDHAFEENESLRSVVLHEGIVSIGERAFANCKNLEEVSVLGPADVADEAFYGCKKLQSVCLADGVKSLEYSCFAFCEALETLFIPKSVEVVRGLLSPQNDYYYRCPAIFCEAPARPEKWAKNFEEYYYDGRFGHVSGHIYYHSVMWGCKRQDEKNSNT